MIVSFVKARQCVRCKRKRDKREPEWGAMQFSMARGLLHWFQPRFTICPECLDELYEMAEENPGIHRVFGDE